MTSKVYVFVDHSNINIMSQKCSGKEQNFPEGVDDHCTRVVPMKIFDFLKGYMDKDKAQIEEMFCYTSDSTMLNNDNIGGRKITPKVFQKGGWNNREKRVDTHMVADAVEIICEKKDRLGFGRDPGVISLWTGDTDILSPVIEKAERHGWKVDVWSFKGSLNTSVIEKHPEVTKRTKYLEEVFKEITERKTGWKPNAEKIPPVDCSFKIRFKLNTPELEKAKENWRDIVDTLSHRAELPLQAWCNWENALMYLILAVPHKEAHNYMRIIWDRKEGLQEKIRSFMEIKFQLRSSCCVEIDGTYPQPRGLMGNGSGKGYGGPAQQYHSVATAANGRSRGGGRLNYQSRPRGTRGMRGQ